MKKKTKSTVITNLKNKIEKNKAIYIITLLVVIAVFIDAYYCNLLIADINDEQPTLVNALGGILALLSLWLFSKRLKAQENQVDQQREQIDLQIKQRVDELFNTAVNLLGSAETSARTGAIYSLVELANEDEKYRKQIFNILCSHIRSKTQEDKYQNQHKKRPSNEIQTCIDLLFKDRGLYERFYEILDNENIHANLSYAYLVGADFDGAFCKNADFRYAKNQGASFIMTQNQGANFNNAQNQGANFGYAQNQGADFWMAQNQGVFFWNTQNQGANFKNTQNQGANFEGADFSGVTNRDHYFQTISLKDRIGKNTELTTAIFTGALDKEVIESIEDSKKYLDEDWYIQMQEIINENKNKEKDFSIPKEIIQGVLKDSAEIQAIINKD